ncbi:hypothetical protein Ccrd_014638 [Cynara cardunculus var. scolymus]|uniref:Uncharacterized protein n=1 Tax=Cynara cardunculus var. scolymus TaxID=59895 RepID=A0A103YDD1_CYNCS|nr:hypothetical protein Ccrd_014638 [Cynara cardunculus var. scolymus]
MKDINGDCYRIRLSPYSTSKANYPWKSQVEKHTFGKKTTSIISDFSLHLLLNPAAPQEMLEDAAAEGYTTPELSKMKDVSRESDIYNLGKCAVERDASQLEEVVGSERWHESRIRFSIADWLEFMSCLKIS